jgi:Kef-type K+ transport system membrane component KefB/nucleotide-binding universal stress UspA family protein
MTASHRPVRANIPAQSRSLRAAGFLLAAIILILPTTAFAAEGAASVSSEAIFIAELGLLLLVGRLMGEAAQRLGQPAVMGQLIGGLLLGPSVLGLIWPAAQHALFPGTPEQKSMINAVSQLGILMLLLLTGMETDLQLVKRVGRAAVTVATAGVALPFICGFALGEMLPDALLPNPGARLVTAIFLGTALSISSVKIVAMVVREMNFMRRDLGQIIVASAILEDTIGWVIIAVAFGLASAGTVDLWSLGRAVLGTAAFMAASLTIGRRIVFNLIRWTNDNFKSEFPVITIILVIMIAMALITQLIGVNTVLGAFVAGILIGESPILTRHIDEQLRGLIVALFMPVFFGLSGLSADLTVLKNPQLALLALGLIVIASVGKFLGAFVGGKLGGLTRAESLALGCGMNARGSTEVIVATIGLSMGVLNRDLFTLIVTMAIVTTLAMPPMLRWALKRLPMRKKERVRLEREELDARGFVTNLERLLLAADDSVNGQFASRLAGAIAGSGGKLTTIVDMSKEDRSKKIAKPKEPTTEKSASKPDEKAAAKTNGKEAKETVETAAEGIDTLEAHPDEEKPGNVDVIARSDKPKGPQALADEARKGYDFMVVGIAKTRSPDGGFSKDISLITKGFEGPLAVVDAHDSRRDRLPRRYGKILIPVNGTEVSRRAAEIGLTLARANDAQVTALFVTRANGGGRKANSAARKRATRRNERAILKDIGALADRYDVDVRSTTLTNLTPGEAIIREARRGYDLVVLGVSRRPGETLFFGDTAASVLERSDTSNLFVAS